MLIPIVTSDQLPAPGEPSAALDAVVAGAVFQKPSGYICVDLALMTVSNDLLQFAVYRYFEDLKAWLPEGPRGTTPTDFSKTENIPIRVSTPFVACKLCVVASDDANNFTASLEAQNR